MRLEIPVTIRRPGVGNPFTPGVPTAATEEHMIIAIDTEDLKKALASLGKD